MTDVAQARHRNGMRCQTARSRRRCRHNAYDAAHHLARDVLCGFNEIVEFVEPDVQFVSDWGAAGLGRFSAFSAMAHAALFSSPEISSIGALDVRLARRSIA